MTFGAPETEALDGGSAPIEPRDLRVDGSPIPLGSIATNEPIEIPRSLWGRWKSLDPQDQNPVDQEARQSKTKEYQR
ncbi:MAG: hypothetical protein RQ885_12870 [Desulfurococcales archaeon]|jgi:hypothetical protein|nr:hypothetical protein [Desulfurococcales archaeon]